MTRPEQRRIHHHHLTDNAAELRSMTEKQMRRNMESGDFDGTIELMNGLIDCEVALAIAKSV